MNLRAFAVPFLIQVLSVSSAWSGDDLPFGLQLALFHATQTLEHVNTLGSIHKPCNSTGPIPAARADATVSCQLPELSEADLKEVAQMTQKAGKSPKSKYIVSLDLENDNVLMGLGSFVGANDNDLGKTHGMKLDVVKNNSDDSTWDASVGTTLYTRTLENDSAYWKVDPQGRPLYKDSVGVEFVEDPVHWMIPYSSNGATVNSRSIPQGDLRRARREKVGITYTEVNRFSLEYTSPEKLGLLGYRLGGGLEFYNNTYSTTFGAQAQQRAWHGLFGGIDMVQYEYYRDPNKPRVTIVPFAAASLIVNENILINATCNINVGAEVGVKVATTQNASNAFVQAGANLELNPLNLKIKALYRLYTRDAQVGTAEVSYKSGNWGEFFTALNFIHNSENPDLQIYLEKPKLGVPTSAKERTMNLGVRILLNRLWP